MEKAVILSEGASLQAEQLQLASSQPPVMEDMQEEHPIQTLDEMERTLVLRAIEQSEGNLTQAAALLGITRQTLYNKMKRHGL